MRFDAEYLQDQSALIARRLVHDFYKCHKLPAEILAVADPRGFSWIDADEMEVFRTAEAAQKYFVEQRRKIDGMSVKLQQEQHEAQILAKDLCLVVYEYLLCGNQESGEFFRCHKRVTIIIREETTEKFYVSHIHTANPWETGVSSVTAARPVSCYTADMAGSVAKGRFTELKELTRRQNQILSQLVQGRTYPQIALLLGITERMVRYHINEICARYRVTGRKQLMAYLFDRVLQVKGESLQ